MLERQFKTFKSSHHLTFPSQTRCKDGGGDDDDDYVDDDGSDPLEEGRAKTHKDYKKN